MNTKTLVVHVPSPFVVKNFLTTDAFTPLMQREDLRIVLLAPHFKAPYYEAWYQEWPRITVVPIPEQVLMNKLDLAYQFVIQNSLPTNTVRIKQSKFLFHGGGPWYVRAPLFLVMRLFWYAGMIPVWKHLVGGVYKIVAPRSFKSLFETEDVSLLYVPNMLHSVDLRLMLEARRHKVPVLGSIASWDNLTAKLVLPFPPDVVAVGNETIEKEIAEYDQVPSSRVRIVGYPQYDRYFKREGLLTREEFCAKSGLDPNRPYVLYAMAGPKNMSSEMDVLLGIKDALDTGLLPDTQVLIRPYPKYLHKLYEEKNLAADSRFVFDEHVATSTNDGTHWELSNEDIFHLANSIHHAAVITSVASTILIDAAVLDRPMLNIAYSGKPEGTTMADRYNSPSRYLEYDHVQKLISADALVTAHTREEMVAHLGAYLKDPERDRSQRENLKMIQCAYTDGQSGVRLGAVIQEMLDA